MAVTPPWLIGYGPGADSIADTDTLATAADSAADADTLAGEHMAAIVITAPERPTVPEAPDTGVSWIYAAMAVMFCVIALHIKNSPRYFRALINDLTDTRERPNVFDETVRETSFLALMNLMWCMCMGILLWQSLAAMPTDEWYSITIPDRPASGIALCTGICVAYDVAMMLVYWVVGNVFTDNTRTGMWVRGAAASNALETVLLFPVALLALTQPGWLPVLQIIAAVTFVSGKLIFIFKGFRIFFSQMSSWLLFLYYLCSLEIVPLILTYLLTLELCLRVL